MLRTWKPMQSQRKSLWLYYKWSFFFRWSKRNGILKRAVDWNSQMKNIRLNKYYWMEIMVSLCWGILVFFAEEAGSPWGTAPKWPASLRKRRPRLVCKIFLPRTDRWSLCLNFRCNLGSLEYGFLINGLNRLIPRRTIHFFAEQLFNRLN